MSTARSILVVGVAALTLFSCSNGAEDRSVAPAVEPADADGPLLGEPGRTLFWTAEQQIPSYRNYPRIYPTRSISAGDSSLPLAERSVDLTGVSYEIEGETFDLDGFFEHNRVVGLIVVDDGAIAYERYAHGNDRDTRWVSYSIAKSVVSLLVGAAVRDGFIEAIDAPVTDYLPQLRGSSYADVTIRHALQMASGVRWNEDYADPESDVATSGGSTLDRLRYLSGLPRVAAAGSTFNYNTGETHLVGAVLRAAIGNNLSTYLEHEIWRPYMESDATWLLVQEGGAEHGGCCISATLRDYARLGLFAMGGGTLPGGTEVLADGWMQESTTPSPGSERYGFLWWLGEAPVFRGIGIYGQTVWVDPARDLVIVTHSAWPRATGREFSVHTGGVIQAITQALDGAS
ncbi:MAG: serine hydrolase domain-containing protein [Acidobacteriota bacterium]|nr:serine hydrolase domain-containing protein [Acidobacteriota bacterium]